MENTYIVQDIATFAVLLVAPSRLNANYISRGILNSTAIQYSTAVPWRANIFKGFNLKDDLMQMHKTKNRHVIPRKMPEDLITPLFLQNRELAKMRSTYLYALEQYTLSNTVRAEDILDPQMLPFITDQISKCDPSTNTYTDAVKEYAYISNIEVSVAYQEWSMRLETAGLVRLRGQALFDKYAYQIINAVKIEECAEALNSAYHDYYMKAAL